MECRQHHHRRLLLARFSQQGRWDKRHSRLRPVQHRAEGEPQLREVVHPDRQRLRDALRADRSHAFQLRVNQVN